MKEIDFFFKKIQKPKVFGPYWIQFKMVILKPNVSEFTFLTLIFTNGNTVHKKTDSEKYAHYIG